MIWENFRRYGCNGQLNTEDIPAAGLTLGNGFLEDIEDTGLDGCFDETENGWEVAWIVVLMLNTMLKATQF